MRQNSCCHHHHHQLVVMDSNEFDLFAMHGWLTRWTDAYQKEEDKEKTSVKICCVWELKWNLAKFIVMISKWYEATVTLVFFDDDMELLFGSLFVYFAFGTLERHNLSARGRFQLIRYAHSIQIRKYIHCLLKRFHFLFWAYTTLIVCICVYVRICKQVNQLITMDAEWRASEQTNKTPLGSGQKWKKNIGYQCCFSHTASTSMHTSICHCGS